MGQEQGKGLNNHPARKRILLILALLLLSGFVYGIYWLSAIRGTVYTDDAQIQALVVPCSSRVGGRVEEILVWEGQMVKKGQVLARLDDMPYRAQKEEAEAGVASAQAQLQLASLNLQKARSSLPKEIAIAEAELKSAMTRESLARREKEHLERLPGVATREQLDQANTAWQVAQSNLIAARQKLSLLTSPQAKAELLYDPAKNPQFGSTVNLPPRVMDILILEGQVEIAKANLNLAQARLDLATDNLSEIEVIARADGQIAKRHIEPGQVVAPGQTIFSISVISSPWVEANFEETDIAGIKPGCKARIKVDAYKHRTFNGYVDNVLGASISRFSLLPSGATSGNFIKVTQRVPVRILFADKDLPALYPGLNVEVRVEVADSRARGKKLAKTTNTK